MKKLHILVGLAGCCLWISCAHDRAGTTNKNVAQPDNSTSTGQTATFPVANTNGGPITYQWDSSGTNTGGGAPFSVVAGGTNGGPLYYQWNFNGTNISGVTNR